VPCRFYRRLQQRHIMRWYVTNKIQLNYITNVPSDIDECADPQLNNCAELGLNCTNLPGRFQCTDCEIGSYRPTPGSQCRFQSCGNGVWDDKEDCDGGLGCFANNCTCAPLWEPTQPRSPDCRRRKLKKL
jgi:hypothetical protein